MTGCKILLVDRIQNNITSNEIISMISRLPANANIIATGHHVDLIKKNNSLALNEVEIIILSITAALLKKIF